MKKVVSFLLIAAMALAMIGCGNAADTTTVAPETTKAPETTVATEETTEAPAADLNCEIVVVGAGGAGMVSALQAVENGAESVIIVEKNWMVGGNSILSTGGMNAAETPNQDNYEFKATAGVEKTLNTAATAWADNATVQALAATVQAQYDAYKANPESFKGSVADISMFIRVAVTGKFNAPDLYTSMQIMGRETVEKRINSMIDSI